MTLDERRTDLERVFSHYNLTGCGLGLALEATVLYAIHNAETLGFSLEKAPEAPTREELDALSRRVDANAAVTVQWLQLIYRRLDTQAHLAEFGYD